MARREARGVMPCLLGNRGPPFSIRRAAVATRERYLRGTSEQLAGVMNGPLPSGPLVGDSEMLPLFVVSLLSEPVKSPPCWWMWHELPLGPVQPTGCAPTAPMPTKPLT